MQLVFILAVSLIAVFMVDCRSHPGPDSQLPNIAEEHKRQQTQGPFITAEPEHLAETTITDGTPEEPPFTIGFDTEEEEELSESELRGSTCKGPKALCLLNGGKCTNASDCQGRFVAELCKGNCGCCLPECPDQPSNSSSTTFIAPGTHQCMRIFTDRRNWTDAKAHCEKHGMELAHPYNAIALTSYLIQKFGYYLGFSWLNAKGQGSYMQWQDDKQVILSYNPLWYRSSYRGGNTSYCLSLAAYTPYWRYNTTTPYWSTLCRYHKRALCELKLKKE